MSSNRIELKWGPQLGNIRDIQVAHVPITWPHLNLYAKEGGQDVDRGNLLSNDTDLLDETGNTQVGSSHQKGYLLKSPVKKSHAPFEGFVGIVPRRAPDGTPEEHPGSYWRTLKFFSRLNPTWYCKCSFPSVTNLNWYGGFRPRDERAGQHTDEAPGEIVTGTSSAYNEKAYFFYTSNHSGITTSNGVQIDTDLHNKLCFLYTNIVDGSVEYYISKEEFSLVKNKVYEFRIDIIRNKIYPYVTVDNKKHRFLLGNISHSSNAHNDKINSGSELQHSPAVDPNADYLPVMGLYTTEDNEPSRVEILELNYSRDSNDITLIGQQ